MQFSDITMITHDEQYIDRRILLEAATLVENGHRVTIISPFSGVPGGFENPSIQFRSVADKQNTGDVVAGLRYKLRTYLPSGVYGFLKNLFFQLTRSDYIPFYSAMLELALHTDADVFVAHDLPALPIAARAAREKQAYLVYDSHEFFLGQAMLQGRRKDFYGLTEKEHIREPDLVMTVNRDIANLFTETYAIPEPEIILNAAPENRETSGQVNLHRNLGISERKRIILFQGAFLEDRNIEVLVESAAFLPDDMVLVLLGMGVMKHRLKKKARRKKILDRRVFFMQSVPPSEIIGYCRGASLGVIPYPAVDENTRFCTPNKLFDFIRAEVPVVANKDLVTVNALLDEYGIGRGIEFSDPEAIADSLSKISEDDITEWKLKLPNASEQLSWEKQEQKLLSCFRRMFRRPPASRTEKEQRG
mgnify:CR=1 FL=1